MYAILDSNTFHIVVTTLSVIITVIGYALLIAGGVCNSTGGWISDKYQCMNVYISGIFITFTTSVIWLFTLLFYLIDRCDAPVVENPIVRPVRKVKKKKNPLQGIVVQ